MKKMNLPNRLTLLRILLVPAVIAVILIDAATAVVCALLASPGK